MSWLSLQIPFFGLSLLATDGRRQVCLDVDPSKWQTRISFEDALLTVMSDIHTQHLGHFSGWNTGKLNHNEIIRHPDFTILPGGLFIHAGTPLTGAAEVRLSPEDVILPSGLALSRAHFSQAMSYGGDEKSVQDLTELLCSIPISNPEKSVAGMVFGALSAMEKQSFCDWPSAMSLRDMAAYLGGLAGQILAGGKRSGKSARDLGAKQAHHVAGMMLSLWALRPDRGWCPREWMMEIHPSPWRAQLDSQDYAAGYNGARALLMHAPRHQSLQALLENDTAHAVVARVSMEKSITSALLTAWAPTGRLKPSAARRMISI